MTVEEIDAKLKSLPEPVYQEKVWLDYSALGFGTEEVETLLDRMSDYYLNLEQDEEASAMSIHAWRALAMMRKVELLPDFVDLALECEAMDDEWLTEDLQEILVLMGMPAVPQLHEAVLEHPSYPIFVTDVLEALPKLVQSPQDRAEVVEILTSLLSDEQFDRDLRAMALASLCDLKAQEKIAEIRAQFEANRINISITGDLEEVEIALGLRTDRDTPKPHFGNEEARLAQREKEALAGEFPATGSRVDQLQYFFLRYGRPNSIQRVDQLDGFLLALCLSGIQLTDQERSQFVWDPLGYEKGPEPNFHNHQEKELWRQCLREHATAIESGLAEGRYHPELAVWPDAEESMDPEAPYFTPWLEGFMAGNNLFNDEGDLALSTLADFEKVDHLCQQIADIEEAGLRLLEDAEDNPVYELMTKVGQLFHNRRKRSLIGDQADEGLTSGEGSPASPPSAKVKKVERNEPCPCGSGRKYKKCCWN